MRKIALTFCLTIFLTSFAQDHLKVGLVLGGGGAKGAAEIGVLKYIEEAGVHIDYIVGTSIGSIIGGLYSVGYRSQQLDSLFVNTDWENIFSESIAGTQQISNVFSDLLNLPDSVDFNSLPIPYRCVATDIINTEEVILQRGNLARAMRASMSIPGAFKPVKWEGKLLVDGGMLNNLPVDIAKKWAQTSSLPSTLRNVNTRIAIFP